MLKGNDLILTLVGTRLAAAKGCSVDRNVDTIEVCSPTDGAARNFVPTTTSWAISANGLYANASGAERLRQIWRAYQQGQHTAMRVQYRTEEGLKEQGAAIMTNLQEQGNVNELVKFSIQLQGTGKLSVITTHYIADGTPIENYVIDSNDIQPLQTQDAKIVVAQVYLRYGGNITIEHKQASSRIYMFYKSGVFDQAELLSVLNDATITDKKKALHDRFGYEYSNRDIISAPIPEGWCTVIVNPKDVEKFEVTE